MSNVLIDDESSRLKHFIWEELDGNFFIAVIFRSGRRYVVQRHFEQQLYDIKSSVIQNKWRRCLLEVISNSLSPIYITFNEVQLMHEIFSWHLNYVNNVLKLRENIDYIIDFEDLLDRFNSISCVDDNSNNNNKAFVIQPVTTLDAARKSIEMWKNLQENIIEDNVNQTVDKPDSKNRIKTPTLPVVTKSTSSSDYSSSLGWLQLDSKIVPFIKKQCDRLLPVEYLLKEHIISSSEDFSLHSLYIPIQLTDVFTFNTLIRQSSSLFNIILTDRSSLITLDHLIFRLKRLFFIRFLSSPINIDSIDYHKIMSFHGGLLTLVNPTKQRIPFIYINKVKYIPQITNLNLTSTSTFCMANKYELEYLRLVSLYDYLSSEDNNDNLVSLLSVTNLILIPIDLYYEEKLQSVISLNDFHYHEYQRRTQQQRNLYFYDDHEQISSGWWQPPLSSTITKRKRSLCPFKLQRPIFF